MASRDVIVCRSRLLPGGRLRRFFDGISYILNDGAGGADGSISLPAFRIPADDILSSGSGGSLHMGDGSGK